MIVSSAITAVVGRRSGAPAELLDASLTRSLAAGDAHGGRLAVAVLPEPA